jgi:hypothetical protein
MRRERGACGLQAGLSPRQGGREAGGHGAWEGCSSAENGKIRTACACLVRQNGCPRVVPHRPQGGCPSCSWHFLSVA